MEQYRVLRSWNPHLIQLVSDVPVIIMIMIIIIIIINFRLSLGVILTNNPRSTTFCPSRMMQTIAYERSQ